jgi:antagonist of KipI
MNLTVKRAGFLASVQDLGRAGHRDIGVSLGGALDAHALRVANVLAGNDPAAAGIELTLGAASLEFTDDRVVAWCGGDFSIAVNDEAVPAGHVRVVAAGDELRAAPASGGGRAWLAIGGGIDVPVVLGSRATDLRSQFGGFEGRALRDGDVLPLGSARRISPSREKVSTWSAPSEWSNTRPRHPFLRMIKGSDAGLGAATWAQLMEAAFTVGAESDRMGVRLEGAELEGGSGELVSEAVSPGTIQLPPGGKPIVLLGDCQTIGGYPKIAHVITVDLGIAAQLRAGDAVRFATIGIADAQRLLIERERDFALFRVGVALRTE